MGRTTIAAALAIFTVALTGCAQGPGGIGHQASEGRTGPDHTPGWHMMSQAERDEHHRRMLAARTPEECRQAMDEHRRQMQERAGPSGMAMPPQDACAGMQR